MVEARALQTVKDGKLERCCGFELDVKRFLHTWLASQGALLRTKTYDLKTWLFSVFIKWKLIIIKTILYDFWPKRGPKTRFLRMKNCLTLITYAVNFCKRNILTLAQTHAGINSKKNTRGSRLTSAFLSVPVFVFLPEKSLFGEGARVHFPNFKWLVSYY